MARRKIIRIAKEEDHDKVIELYIKGLKETGAKNISQSLVVKKVVSSYPKAPCFLLVIDGNIVGIAGLDAGILPWSGEPTLTDYMFYIEPEYRSLSNLGGLVEECKRFAVDMKLPLRLDFIVNDDEAVRRRLFKKHSIEPISITGAYND